MSKQQKQHDDDDGRVICDMDVEGMRWHDRRVRREERAQRRTPQGDPLTKAEARRFTAHALLASFLVVAVFSITWVLFVLFCTEIWFR